ncbi:hypothetical protein [Saccharopolyspora sp. NPDC050642]|uniref:hypothetical protein n=1 Tax=Saccharopolyspora sp. NPDC050642 TaxID=3157099 RepID=UPI0033C5062A
MESDPRHVVEKGYDRIAHRYAEWIEEIHGDPRLRFLTELTNRLPAAASAVDLGCGSGKPREPEGPATFQWVLARAEPEPENDYHTCDSFTP